MDFSGDELLVSPRNVWPLQHLVFDDCFLVSKIRNHHDGFINNLVGTRALGARLPIDVAILMLAVSR